jgi:hypothetical protein
LHASKETCVKMGRAQHKFCKRLLHRHSPNSRDEGSMEVYVLAANCFLGVNFVKVLVNLRHFQYNVRSVR